MILPRIFTLFWAIALAGFVSAIPLDPRQLFAKRMTLGYRTVSPEQAKMYNKNGKVSFDPYKAQGSQIGIGVYTSPSPGEYRGNPGDWFCQITARKSAVYKIPKLWIPRDNWWYLESHEKTTQMYDWADKTLPPGPKDESAFDYAFHLSIMSRYDPPGLKQLLIPSYLLTGHGLDLQVQCKDSIEKLPSQKRVDYYGWPNTYGEPQH